MQTRSSHIIKKDNECVNKLIDIIVENLTPFAITDSEHIFNIASGKSANEKTEDFVLNIFKVGNQELLKFISECRNTPQRFAKPIKNKSSTLLRLKREQTTRIENKKAGKLMETYLVRDIFGSSLFLSLEKKVDM